MRALLLLFCLVAGTGIAQAAIEAYEFDNAQMEADYNRLIDELRCLVCQNQNLAESDADLARDLRRETYEMLSQGSTPDEVTDFMVQRYGDFVLYRPQFKSSTYLLWIGPFLLMLAALVYLVRRLRATGATPAEVDADSLAKARQILENKESKQ